MREDRYVDIEDSALHRLWQLLDAQAWDGLGEVLDPDVQVSYLHSGETLDRDAFVRVNREYPGRWHCWVADVVRQDDREVARVRVSGGGETYWVASFATVHDGRIVELTEVWTSAVGPPPADRRPS